MRRSARGAVAGSDNKMRDSNARPTDWRAQYAPEGLLFRQSDCALERREYQESRPANLAHALADIAGEVRRKDGGNFRAELCIVAGDRRVDVGEGFRQHPPHCQPIHLVHPPDQPRSPVMLYTQSPSGPQLHPRYLTNPVPEL